jgi:hypothetical protein
MAGVNGGVTCLKHVILILNMDIVSMLAELRAERQRLEEAILVIERLAVKAAGKRRGRPPKWMAAAKSETIPEETAPKTRRFSAATRKRMAVAQKKRWAARRSQAQAA